MLEFDIAPCLEHINHYQNHDFMPESLQGLELNEYLPEDGYQLLLQGTHDEPQINIRQEFITFLNERINALIKNESRPRPTITMQKLLTGDGLALFKRAIEEETNSKAFREAVFLQSMGAIIGPMWGTKLVLWVGGPSASGKTYGAENALESLVESIPHTGELGHNHYIAIDGATVREVSQMRKLVLQAALLLNYKGVKDLNDHCSFKVGGTRLKDIVKDAALTHDYLSLLIPETFTESKLRLSNRFMSNDMRQYHNDPNILQAFSQVICRPNHESEFQDVVKYMGNSRAWLDEDRTFELANLHLNSKVPCESKAYGSNGFAWGRDASKEANKRFLKLDPTGLNVKITNDLILVKQLDDGTWYQCSNNDNPDFKISIRDFEYWKSQIETPELTDLKGWWEESKERGDLAPALIELVPFDLVKIPVGNIYKTEEFSHFRITKRDYLRYKEELGLENCSKMAHVRAWILDELSHGRLTTPSSYIDEFERHTAHHFVELQPPIHNIEVVPPPIELVPENTRSENRRSTQISMTHLRDKGKDELDMNEETFINNIELVNESEVDKLVDKKKKDSSTRHRN